MLGGSWKVEVGSDSAGAQRPADAAAPEPESDPREDSEPDASQERTAAADPEAEAIKLLQNELGARPLQDG